MAGGLVGSRAQVVSDSVWIYSTGRYIVVHVYVTVGVQCVVYTERTHLNRFSTLSSVPRRMKHTISASLVHETQIQSFTPLFTQPLAPPI